MNWVGVGPSIFECHHPNNEFVSEIFMYVHLPMLKPEFHEVGGLNGLIHYT